MLVRTFLNDNSGAVTLDWVVLTAALVGTGIAVMSTVSTGIDGLSSQTEAELQGSIIRTSFVGNLCEGGLDAVQADENTRVAMARANGIDTHAINVRRALSDLGQSKADAEVLQLYAEMLGSSFTPLEPETTEKSVLECEIQRRGLL